MHRRLHATRARASRAHHRIRARLRPPARTSSRRLSASPQLRGGRDRAVACVARRVCGGVRSALARRVEAASTPRDALAQRRSGRHRCARSSVRSPGRWRSRTCMVTDDRPGAVARPGAQRRASSSTRARAGEHVRRPDHATARGSLHTVGRIVARAATDQLVVLGLEGLRLHRQSSAISYRRQSPLRHGRVTAAARSCVVLNARSQQRARSAFFDELDARAKTRPPSRARSSLSWR